jgi:hypothetical protein
VVFQPPASLTVRFGVSSHRLHHFDERVGMNSVEVALVDVRSMVAGFARQTNLDETHALALIKWAGAGRDDDAVTETGGVGHAKTSRRNELQTAADEADHKKEDSEKGIAHR